MMFYIALAAIFARLAKPIYNGVLLTVAFVSSMGGSKRFSASIDEYNKLQQGDSATDVDGRNDSYAQLVVSSQPCLGLTSCSEPILRSCHRVL